MTKKKTETTEVVVPEETTADAVAPEAGNVPMVGASEFDLNANLEGVETQYPAIKIIHQGQMFSFPDESKSLSFVGTIIDMNRANAYWAVPFDESGGGDSPTCSSLNGITPEMNSEELQTDTGSCFTCSRNQFGSDGKRGKLCKNMKRIHILLGASKMPFRLTVPPTNLKAVDMYVSLLTSLNVPYQLVQTEFTLKAVKNNDGIEYSELILKNIGPTPLVKSNEDAQRLKALIVQNKSSMRGEQVTGEQVTGREAT